MKPCPECKSNNIYQYEKLIDSEGAYGPHLLPKLASGWFSSAKILPVVCAECGYIRLFAAKEARHNLDSSENWVKC